jgi:hypothetical protein
MNKLDWKWWLDFRNVSRPYLENDEYKMICEIYARVKNIPVDYPCKCNPKKIQKMIDELNELWSVMPKPRAR